MHLYTIEAIVCLYQIINLVKGIDTDKVNYFIVWTLNTYAK